MFGDDATGAWSNHRKDGRHAGRYWLCEITHAGRRGDGPGIGAKAAALAARQRRATGWRTPVRALA